MRLRNVRYEVAEGVATLTMNRPEQLNALNFGLKDDLLQALETAARDETARAVVLTGAGRAFSAGGDVKDMLLPSQEMDPHARENMVRSYNAVVSAMRHLEKPIIAAVNGVAVGGGCCLALAADIRIASAEARFGLVFVRLGLAGSDMGATFLLPRLVGAAHASELLLTGELIDAARAERIGLVNRVVPADRLGTEVRELALRLAAGPPIALAVTKRALNRSLGMDVDDHLDYEAYVQSKCMLTADHREGVRAHLERRPPRFLGQ